VCPKNYTFEFIIKSCLYYLECRTSFQKKTLLYNLKTFQGNKLAITRKLVRELCLEILSMTYCTTKKSEISERTRNALCSTVKLTNIYSFWLFQASVLSMWLLIWPVLLVYNIWSAGPALEFCERSVNKSIIT
jgi:hypothetical protein